MRNGAAVDGDVISYFDEVACFAGDKRYSGDKTDEVVDDEDEINKEDSVWLMNYTDF